jgi:uncharacterized protein (DUF1778 family)
MEVKMPKKTRKSKKPKKDYTIQIRIDQDMKKTLTKKAEKGDLTLSQFVRNALVLLTNLP